MAGRRRRARLVRRRSARQLYAGCRPRRLASDGALFPGAMSAPRLLLEGETALQFADQWRSALEPRGRQADRHPTNVIAIPRVGGPWLRRPTSFLTSTRPC